jgi:hypothetical protein
MNQTKILIVPEYETQFGGTVLVADRTVSHTLTTLGALPIYALDIRTYQEYAELADGLLLLDGTLFHPFRYGGIVESFKELAGYRRLRDDIEFTLTEEFLKRKKPVFGIGRGALVLNTVLGGIPEKERSHVPDPHFSFLNQEVTLQANASLYEIRRLGDGLRPTTLSDYRVLSYKDATGKLQGLLFRPDQAEQGGTEAYKAFLAELIKEAADV